MMETSQPHVKSRARAERRENSPMGEKEKRPGNTNRKQEDTVKPSYFKNYVNANELITEII